ncbi:MAG: rod shape-determining protein MreD [Smithellaceae bacterium]
MIFYLALPFLAVGLIVLQSAIADVLFSGWLVLEASLVVVIYAGFRLGIVKGLIFAFVIGFVFDCLSGSVEGLFSLIYMLIFLCAFFVSLRMVTEKLYLIALFSLACALIEMLLLIAFYHFTYSFDLSSSVMSVFVPQALMVSVLSVGFFYTMRRIEGFFYGNAMQPPQRA